MNIKRALWISLLIYIASFIIGIVGMIVIGFDPSQSATGDLPTSFYVIGVIASVVLASLFSLWYFSGRGIKAGAKEGLYLGLTMFFVGFALDIIIYLLMLAGGGADFDILAYYSHPIFWVAAVLIVASASVVGALKKR